MCVRLSRYTPTVVTADLPCRRTNHQCQIERMWDLDTVSITEREMSTLIPDDACLPTWNLKEGRYEMGLVWRSEESPVTNRTSAAVRTKRMTKKLGEEKLRRYRGRMLDMLNNSIIEPEGAHTEITETDDGLPCKSEVHPSPDSGGSNAVFLPHRGVFGKEKLITVFDGSAKDGVSKSLNDYLSPGENLLRKLPGVVLNFPNGKIGCQSDIRLPSSVCE